MSICNLTNYGETPDASVGEFARLRRIILTSPNSIKINKLSFMIKSLLKRKVNKLLKHYLNHQILRYHPWDDNYKWITNKKISTIIDIGANDGEFANHISSILPEAKFFLLNQSQVYLKS